MKLYLYAPIVIAGLTATVGAVAIAKTEFGIFKSGQQVVALLKSQGETPRLDSMRLDRGESSGGDVQLRFGNDFDKVASNDLPAPEVTAEVSPLRAVATPTVGSRTKRNMHRSGREVRIISAPALPANAPQPMTYKFKDGDGFRFSTRENAKNPVVTLTGLPETCPKLELSFDRKKFAEQQKEFAKQMTKVHGDQWRVFTQEDLKQLKSFAMASEFKAFDENGIAHVIRIDPRGMAAQAEKMGVDSATAGTADTIPTATDAN